MGQGQNRMEGAMEPEQTLCQRNIDFISDLKNFIQPEDPERSIYIEFRSRTWTPNVASEDIGKVQQIRNGILRNPESGIEYIDLNTINYDDPTGLGKLLNLNRNGQNSLASVSLNADGSFSGNTNNEFLVGKNRLFKTIDCDAQKNCLCYFTQSPFSEEMKQVVMRAATKIG